MAPAGAPFAFVSNAARIVPFSGIGPDARYRRGWSLSHLLYTASDISLENPPEDDHPYAGYLALSVFSTAIQDNSENTLSFELGLIGPSAQGEFVQRNWHQHVLHEAIDPAGWSTQLHDEVVFAVALQRLRRWDVLSSQRWNTDAYPCWRDIGHGQNRPVGRIFHTVVAGRHSVWGRCTPSHPASDQRLKLCGQN